jgi:hypothetical protein
MGVNFYNSVPIHLEIFYRPINYPYDSFSGCVQLPDYKYPHKEPWFTKKNRATFMMEFLDISNICDALTLSHGSRVNLIAVVASVGPVTPRCTFDPYTTRDIKDSRFGFLAISLFVDFSFRQ